MTSILPEINLSTGTPDRMIALVDPEVNVELVASIAVEGARTRMPRVTSALANRLQPIATTGMYGIYFPDKRIWYMEQGTSPFTMRNLPRGKAIPMWINDPDGRVKRENPKAETRRTDDGRMQTKIFRKVAQDGARRANAEGRMVRGGYPGAPGRISRRTSTGQIGAGNVGVQWRHPGISAREFLSDSLAAVSERYGLGVDSLYLCDSATFYLVEQAVRI